MSETDPRWLTTADRLARRFFPIITVPRKRPTLRGTAIHEAGHAVPLERTGAD